MLAAIKHNLTHLADFAGKESRRSFWYYVLFVILLNILVSFAVSIPITAGAVSQGMASAGTSDPVAIEAAVGEHLAASMAPLIWTSIALSLLNIVLLAATLVRRLHDAGKPGYWVVAPLFFSLWAMYLTYAQLGSIDAIVRQAMDARTASEVMGMQTGMWWRSLVSWMPFILLVIIGLMKPASADAAGDDALL